MKKITQNKKGLRLSNMIIGMLLTVGVMMGLFAWMVDGVNNYGVNPPDDYNESFFKIQGVYGNLSENIGESYNQIQNISTNTGSSGVVDFLGFFFSSGYRAAQTAVKSISSMFTLTDIAISETPISQNLPNGTNYADLLKGLLWLGLVVVFSIGILLNYVIKSGRE